MQQSLQIDPKRCLGCWRCVNDCVAGNLTVEKGVAVAKSSCILCGHCVSVCPTYAVTIPKYEMSDVETYVKDDFDLDADRLLKAIKYRRSIRQYANKPIEQEKLECIVQAGRYTATAVNRQACRFVVVQNNLATLKELIWSGIESAEATPEGPSAELLAPLKNLLSLREKKIDYLFRDAPAVIYVAAENITDAALAAQNMELAAVSQDLGMLYNGFLLRATNMNPSAREWLDIPDLPVAICMLLGYPRVKYYRTAPRREADVRWR